MRLTFADVPLADDVPLPDFRKPPVVEVSVGYMFSGLQNYTSLKAASFHAALRPEYPLVEEHPPLGPTFETFGPVDVGTTQIRFEMLQGAVQPRFFFVSPNQAELIQLQGDRLHYNWRKTSDDEGYPRFPQIRDRYANAWRTLQSWARKEMLGQPIVTQCEVVYVNRIPLVGIDEKPCGLASIFHWLTGLPGITEDGAFQYRQRLNDESGRPVARLICSLNYGTSPNGQRDARLMLTVRGRPLEPDEDAFAAFLEEGRKVIVRTFAILTSEEAHKMWERVA